MGFLIELELSVAVLEAGLASMVQVNERASLSGSDDAEPFNWTVLPSVTNCAPPALAIGGSSCVLMVTVAVELLLWESVTVNCATYVPAVVARNVGETAVGLEIDAWLPAGADIRLHWNVIVSPSGELEPLPSRRTTVPTPTNWFFPALAMGGTFCVEIVTCAVEEFVPSLTDSCAT